ncbi:CFS1-like protein [Mycena sanguinolenta]|uniref:CFS1-like protein n=1 Tax=Mycena sanguinolenta TaxID=230812 RepID=A0A8H6U1C9_9AGAR|nr:CFS1-like protein [Mycena sanguinolenta]
MPGLQELDICCCRRDVFDIILDAVRDKSDLGPELQTLIVACAVEMEDKHLLFEDLSRPFAHDFVLIRKKHSCSKEVEKWWYGPEVDCDDISSLIQILIANWRALTAGTDTILVWTLSKGRLLTRNKFIGSLTNSRANISAHYDLGNEMFSAFLSKDMNYLSVIFKDFNEDLDPTTSVRESLEDAQLRKARKRTFCLDSVSWNFGTGWGSLAILAAKMFDCTVETVTLSFNQAAFARERIKEAKLSNKVTVHCMDFRECTLHPEWAGSFDRVISVEMLNHIGKDFLIKYWVVIDWALKPNTRVGVIQGICIPEARVAQYDASIDFAQKWVVFPGGYLPSFNFLVETLNKGSAGHLMVDSVLNIGPHYSRTLHEWKWKFLANWNSVIAKALVAQYNLDTEGLEIFKRKWIYYL